MGTNLNQTGKSKPSKQTSSTMNENYVRSYSCDFCKKGFSNAQALGGHMNIHRRDRAKLRQSSMDNNDNDMQSGGNLSVILDDQCSTQSQQSTSTSQNQTVTGSTTTENREGGVSVTHELPLFVDGHVTSVGGSSGTLSRLRRDELLSLDLELRLGSKPQNKHPT